MSPGPNAKRYRAMSEPYANVKDANDAVQAFFDGVEALRETHRIADVHLCASINVIHEEGNEYTTMARYHLGDSLRALPMLADAFGSEQERHKVMIAGLLAQPKKGR